MNYYNEFDPYPAQWIENLGAAGLIPVGDVDRRSIAEVDPLDLLGYEQCHFFAGIAGWSYALELAGWPRGRPVWTGSCPCQPFSAAGKRKGVADARHLWPEFLRLIAACRPPVIFGEQVASPDVIGRQSEGSRLPIEIQAPEPGEGFDPSRTLSLAQEGHAVRSERARYENTKADRRRGLRSDRVALQSGQWPNMGQPLHRSARPSERLHLLEHSGSLSRREQRDRRLGRDETFGDCICDVGAAESGIKYALGTARAEIDGADQHRWLARVRSDLAEIGYAFGACILPAAGVGAPHLRQRLYWVAESERDIGEARRSSDKRGERDAPSRTGASIEPGRRGTLRGLADTNGRDESHGHLQRSREHGFWSQDTIAIPCTDGKLRRVPSEPSFQPLADGVPGRLGQLRAYGNAIVPQVAAQFISAFLECRP